MKKRISLFLITFVIYAMLSLTVASADVQTSTSGAVTRPLPAEEVISINYTMQPGTGDASTPASGGAAATPLPLEVLNELPKTTTTSDGPANIQTTASGGGAGVLLPVEELNKLPKTSNSNSSSESSIPASPSVTYTNAETAPLATQSEQKAIATQNVQAEPSQEEKPVKSESLIGEATTAAISPETEKGAAATPVAEKETGEKQAAVAPATTNAENVIVAAVKNIAKRIASLFSR